MELKEWIRSARKMAGLTQTQLGEALGVTKGNVSAWENGRHDPSYAQLQQIAEIAHVPLPGGEYKHISATAESLNKTGKPALSAPSQTLAGDSIATGTQNFDKNVAPARLGPRQIPVISYVQAGKMTEAVDPFSLGFGFETIQPTVECSEHSFALKIDGDSMEPRFHEGDVVIIDPEREPRPGNFVVAKNGKEEATFKKYRPRGTDGRGNMIFELVPLNDDYPTLHSERDHLQIIGVCVELRQAMI